MSMWRKKKKQKPQLKRGLTPGPSGGWMQAFRCTTRHRFLTRYNITRKDQSWPLIKDSVLDRLVADLLLAFWVTPVALVAPRHLSAESEDLRVSLRKQVHVKALSSYSNHKAINAQLMSPFWLTSRSHCFTGSIEFWRQLLSEFFLSRDHFLSWEQSRPLT